MNHWHAVRYCDLDGRPCFKMMALRFEHEYLRLSDLIEFRKNTGFDFMQSFYIGYGDEKILDEYVKSGLI